MKSITPYPNELEKTRLREIVIYPSNTNFGAPSVTDFVDSNMKAPKFANNATDNLYYEVDMQHDYIEDTDMELHLHWTPDTGADGLNVKWQVYYQWTEVGEVWQPATLVTDIVTIGTTAWEDSYANFVLDGTGKTWNSRLKIRVFRVGNDAEDTSSCGASLVAVGCHYWARLAEKGTNGM